MSLSCRAAELDALLAERVGAPARWEDRSRPGSTSRVERVTGPRGALFVKTLPSRRAWQREVDGLTRLGPALREVGIATPALWFADPTLGVVALSELPGAPPARGDVCAWERSGVGLAAIQALPCPDDPLPLRDAVLQRLARATGAARGIGLTAEAERVARAVGDASAFGGVTRVPAHRDLAPRNWLVDGSSSGWIDFEHSGPDAPEADLVWVRAADPPACWDAFVAGRGRALDDAAWARLDGLLALFALNTLVWAARHADTHWEGLGRRVLAELPR